MPPACTGEDIERLRTVISVMSSTRATCSLGAPLRMKDTQRLQELRIAVVKGSHPLSALFFSQRHYPT